MPPNRSPRSAPAVKGQWNPLLVAISPRLPPANDDRFGRGDGRGRERRAVRSLTAVEISLHAVYRGPTSARAEGPDPAAMAEATSSEGPVNAASTKPTQQESVWLDGSRPFLPST